MKFRICFGRQLEPSTRCRHYEAAAREVVQFIQIYTRTVQHSAGGCLEHGLFGWAFLERQKLSFHGQSEISICSNRETSAGQVYWRRLMGAEMILPPFLIFEGETHQLQWYPRNTLCLSKFAIMENGWTTNDIALRWLQGHFEPLTRPADILIQQETVTYEGNSLTSRKRKVFIPLRVFLLHM